MITELDEKKARRDPDSTFPHDAFRRGEADRGAIMVGHQAEWKRIWAAIIISVLALVVFIVLVILGLLWRT